MILNTKELYGHKLATLDGDIGHVKDFYFDDKTWVIRYLVANTGSWLTGRLVLLSPHAFGKFDPVAKTLQINLHKKQIEDSPPIESHLPVSRQYEMEYYRHYGWPVYWSGGALWGLGSYPLVLPPSKAELETPPQYHHRDEKHLRSTQAVTGYHVKAADGPVGSVVGFRVDDRSWAIREMVVQTGHWHSGREILIPTGKVEQISYTESTVAVNVTQAEIRQRAAASESANAGAEKGGAGSSRA